MKAAAGIFFFQAEDGIRDTSVTGVQTCALPIWAFTLTALATHTELHGCIHGIGNQGFAAKLTADRDRKSVV